MSARHDPRGYLESEEAFDTLYTDMLDKFPLPIRIDPDATQAIHQLTGVLRRHLPRTPGLSFCEIGCAPGQWLIYFNQYFKFDVAGVDLSADGVRLSNANLRAANVEGRVLHADAFAMPFGKRRFDVVFSHSLVEHFQDPMVVFELYDQMTAPGGFIYCGVPNMRYLNNLIFQINDRLLGKFSELRGVHNIATANPAVFRRAAEKFGWRVAFLDYVGFFIPQLFSPPNADEAGTRLRTVGRFAGRRLVTSRFFSPILAMIAQKPE